MTREQLKEKLRELLVLYTDGISTGMSDPEFDKLVAEYGYDDYIIDIKRPFMATLQGADYVHPIGESILSKQPPKIKINNKDEIQLESDEVMSFKYDGCSVIAYYKQGELKEIVTRGDDFVGKNQTNKLWNKVPHTVNPEVEWIQFEALCRKEDFNESCRGKANGLINSKYKLDEVNLYLHLQPFNVGTTTPMSYEQRMKLANVEDTNVFDIPGWVKGNNGTFPIDGFVIYKGTSPIPTKIYKYYGFEIVETVVENIEWNKSPFGVYVPKLIIREVILSGKRINKVATGGIENLIRTETGIGAVVRVYLSGNTIPQVHSIISKSTQFNFPTCPHCNSKMVSFSTGVHCENIDCPDTVNMIRSRFFNFVGKNVIEEKDYLDTETILNSVGIQRLNDATINNILDNILPPRNTDDNELIEWAYEVEGYLSPTQQGEFIRLMNHYIKLKGEIK